MVDQQGKLRLDTPQAVEALEFYRLMLNDTEATHPASRDMDSVKSGYAFANGEIALMVNWFGFAAMAQTIPESRVKGCIGVAEIPHAEGCAARVPLELFIPQSDHGVHPQGLRAGRQQARMATPDRAVIVIA